MADMQLLSLQMLFSWKGEDVPVWDRKDHCAREATRYLRHIQDDHILKQCVLKLPRTVFHMQSYIGGLVSWH